MAARRLCPDTHPSCRFLQPACSGRHEPKTRCNFRSRLSPASDEVGRDDGAGGRRHLSEEHAVDACHELLVLVQGSVHLAHVGVQPAVPRQLAVHEPELRAKAALKVARKVAVLQRGSDVKRICGSDCCQVSSKRRLAMKR